MKWTNFIYLLLFIGCTGVQVQEKKQDNIGWRNDRTGYYNETNLLKEWPEEGLELLWNYDGIGEGYASIAIANQKIYTTGLLDLKGYLFIFDLEGKLLNKIEYSDEWTDSYNGSRATPTINEGKIYVLSGLGNLVCFDENDLNIIWQKNLIEDYNSKSIEWGFSESILIIGDMLIVTPGGEEFNVVALNKNNGDLIWSSLGVGDVSTFSSPIYIDDQDIPLIVNHTAEHIIGLEAATGNVLWSFEHTNKYFIHANTPVYFNNMILCTSVSAGSKMLRLSNGGRSAEIVWENADLDNMMGAMVKVGNYVFGTGAGSKNKSWDCVHWETGEMVYREKGFPAGATIFADEMLYCYTDKGEMMLINPTAEKFDLISQFSVTLGTDQHWAHPSIYKGVLYIRHGNTLMAYKVK